jgi:lipoprotein-anchoring transpeptidase ErfK/SrfK
VSARPPLPALLLALLVVGSIGGTALSCGGSQRTAGDSYRLSGGQLAPPATAPTTTTTSTIPEPEPEPEPVAPTTVATAAVPELQVHAARPGGASAGAAAAPVAAMRASGLPPIPRADLRSAGMRKTSTGWAYDNPTYWGKPLVMVVTAQEGEWLQVELPARPNGQRGWIRTSDVTLSEHRFRVELRLSGFVLRVWDNHDLLVETPVVVGAGRTPTPTGSFYITDILSASAAGVSPGGPYGPYVLATNAFSESLDLFDGGLPVIALHGTNQPGLVGSAASNGCVRMPNHVVSLLAQTILPGTPIEISD